MISVAHLNAGPAATARSFSRIPLRSKKAAIPPSLAALKKERVRQSTLINKLLVALENERIALERARVAQQPASPRIGVDIDLVRRERQWSRHISNLKWLCIGGGICWIGMLALLGV